MGRVVIVGGAAAAVAAAVWMIRSAPSSFPTVPGNLPGGWIGSAINTWMNGPFYRLMAEALDPRLEDELLDVACGEGAFLAEYASHVRYVAGLDLYDVKVGLAQRRLADRIAAGTGEVVKGDAAALPWEDGRFSAVTCMDAFSFFPDPDGFLREVYRILCPGGRAAMAIGLQVPEGTEARKVLGHRTLSEADVRRMVEAAGFDVSFSYVPVGGDNRLANHLSRLLTGTDQARIVTAVKLTPVPADEVAAAAEAIAVGRKPIRSAVTTLRRRGQCMGTENWYLQNRPRIMREVKFAFRHHRRLLAKAYGKDAGKAIASEAMQRFEVLLPDIPYIGGDENPLTKNLYLTAAMLAMYRSLREHGESVEGAARLIYLGASRFFSSFPSWLLLRWQGRRNFSRKRMNQRRHDAAISQERRYPDDWVFEFVEGDGQTFEYGVDHLECGIVKYLSREGAPELAPYLCWLDYPVFAAMRMKLVRTETLAQGGRRCDFRCSRGQPVQVQPEFLNV